MSEQDLTEVVQLGQYFNIDKHTSGKIQFKLDHEKLKQVQTSSDKAAKTMGINEAKMFLKALNGVDDIQLNIFTASLTVTYQESQIQSQWWDDWVAGNESAELNQWLSDAMKLMDG